MIRQPSIFFFFFFNDTATTEIYTLSLHDALPISLIGEQPNPWNLLQLQDAMSRHRGAKPERRYELLADRKSTRLNSSHLVISYAVFCLKKKKNRNTPIQQQQRKHRQYTNRTKPMS